MRQKVCWKDHGVHISFGELFPPKTEIAKTVDDAFSFIGFILEGSVRMIRSHQIQNYSIARWQGSSDFGKLGTVLVSLPVEDHRQP